MDNAQKHTPHNYCDYIRKRNARYIEYIELFC